MKQTLLAFLLVVLLPQVQADESAYLGALKVAHERFRVLESERNDYRKARTGLPPAQEAERLHLLGQLLTDDPLWALSQQIQADISALSALPALTPADGALMETLKDLLVYVSGFEERATTLAQAEQFASMLRQFVVRRDAAGARKWARSQ